MKTATTALVALVALGSFSLACSSSSSGDEVDTGTALSALRSPTGSFSKASGGSAFAGYRAKRADSAKVSAPTTGTSAASMTGTRSIRLLNQAAGSCAQGEACACPNGGTMSYKGESSADGQLVRVSFDTCGFEDGYGFDGQAILLVSNKSLLGIPEAATPAAAPSSPPTGTSTSSGGLQEAQGSASPAAQQAVSVLLAAKGTVSEGTRKLALEFALVTEAHYAFLAVAVPDGSIVIGLRDDGNAIVRSKEGTWQCHNGQAGWSCTSDKGESIDVSEDASADPATPPAASSASSGSSGSSSSSSAPSR